jgi:4-aminobutyrate aminotransferase/(S)-3-amino-2-methylpropionate transaminase
MPVFIGDRAGAASCRMSTGTIIDFASGIAVTSVGATNAFVQARVTSMIHTLTCFIVTCGFTEVCRWLNITPGSLTSAAR